MPLGVVATTPYPLPALIDLGDICAPPLMCSCCGDLLRGRTRRGDTPLGLELWDGEAKARGGAETGTPTTAR